ncbi:hypothetical protein GRAN_0504 [Granulicella sibirica]|uniref:Uncharacterized protein n=1 Tax=Granulicella sibirica TaxID=2479048 RepID=A0A4V1L5W6_9BACT|nr:hypothetical protein GRAN_0504 [Granulicella sibirica]
MVMKEVPGWTVRARIAMDAIVGWVGGWGLCFGSYLLGFSGGGGWSGNLGLVAGWSKAYFRG